MNQDSGYIPFVSITLESRSRFDWKSYYRAILQALDDPFLQIRRTATERDLQEAVEKALLHRGVEVVIVDEAQHLARAARGSTQQDQLDQLKYFENKLGVCHVLVGTYDMRPFRQSMPSLPAGLPMYTSLAMMRGMRTIVSSSRALSGLSSGNYLFLRNPPLCKSIGSISMPAVLVVSAY